MIKTGWNDYHRHTTLAACVNFQVCNKPFVTRVIVTRVKMASDDQHGARLFTGTPGTQKVSHILVAANLTIAFIDTAPKAHPSVLSRMNNEDFIWSAGFLECLSIANVFDFCGKNALFIVPKMHYCTGVSKIFRHYCTGRCIIVPELAKYSGIIVSEDALLLQS